MSALLSALLPVILLVVFCAPPARAADELEVVGGKGERSLVLRPCRVLSTSTVSRNMGLESGACRSALTKSGVSKTGTPLYTPTVQRTLVGTLPLALANLTPTRERVEILYVRNEGGATHLPGISSFVGLPRDRGPHSALRSVALPPHATRVLPIHFRLPPSRRASALNGTVSVRVLGATTQIVVPVVSTVPVPPGLRLEPGELTLSAGCWCSSASTKITLVGPGAGAFAAAVDTRHTFALHDKDSNEATVTLKGFESSEGNSGLATATISLQGSPSPGAYDGEVTLFSLSPEAPRLKLTVNARRPLWLMIFIVLLGVVIGGFASRVYALDLRKDTLFKALKAALDQLNAVTDALADSVDEVAGVTWYLEDLASGLGGGGSGLQAHSAKAARKGALPTGNLPGVEELLARVKEARNDRDLDEDTDAVLEVIARIQRWMRLAPAAWRLEMVAKAAPDMTLHWHDTKTWRDTRLLQERLLYEPQTVAEADDLVEQVLWQIQWHHKVAELYGHIGGAHGWEKVNHALAAKSVFERTATEREELDFELEQLRRHSHDAQEEGLPKLPASAALQVNWQSTPNLFTGWATVDGTSWRGVRARAAGRGRLRMPSFEVRLCDVIWLVPPLVIASVVYAIPLYTQTWGSCTDVLTALTAGFAGKVLIDWGTLPYFQSRRLRAVPGAAPSG